MIVDVEIPACKRHRDDHPNWCHMKMYDEARPENGGRFWTRSMRCRNCGIFRNDETKTVGELLVEWDHANS